MGEREDSLRLEHGLGTSGTARTGTGWSKRKDSERTRTKTKGRLRARERVQRGEEGERGLRASGRGEETGGRVSGRHGQRWMNGWMNAVRGQARVVQ